MKSYLAACRRLVVSQVGLERKGQINAIGGFKKEKVILQAYI